MFSYPYATILMYFIFTSTWNYYDWQRLLIKMQKEKTLYNFIQINVLVIIYERMTIR